MPQRQRLFIPAGAHQILEAVRIDGFPLDLEPVPSRDLRDLLGTQTLTQVTYVALDQVGS